jgi:hypothetical protein
VLQFAQQQAFDGAAAGDSMSNEARGEHTCVIDDEQVAGAQVIAYARERGVLDRAALTREDQESRLAALSGWTLSDQLIR